MGSGSVSGGGGGLVGGGRFFLAGKEDLALAVVTDREAALVSKRQLARKLVHRFLDGLADQALEAPDATFFDVRTFGAVMSTGVNCGQVRGPVQLTFARSTDPIVATEHSITRIAVATEAEAEKQDGDNRTTGRKHTVPYGLYAAHGFVSSFLATQTGFGEDDLELLWQSLGSMFEHDRSAARGEMSTRGLYVFKHDSELRNAHAHELFKRVTTRKKVDVPRSFDDYDIRIDEDQLPAAVTLLRMVG